MEKLNGCVAVAAAAGCGCVRPKPVNGCGLKIDDVVVAGAPNRVGAAVLAAGAANENGDAVDVAVCAPKPPKIEAAVEVVAAGAPKILVAVDAGAVTPKPVNAGVLVAAPNTGAAVLVAAPKILVAAG